MLLGNAITVVQQNQAELSVEELVQPAALLACPVVLGANPGQLR